MIPIPPTARRPPSRALLPGRWLSAAMALTVVLAGGACAAPPIEDSAGLVIASVGPISVTGTDGRPASIDSPADIRFVTAANGRIAGSSPDGRIFVSDAPRAGEARAWRTMAPDESAVRAPTGIDLSPDGRILALSLGDPDTPDLELVMIDVETGAVEVRTTELMTNGPPSWLGADLLALEVIRPDQHSGIATVDPSSGDVTVTEARGFSPSSTRDGGRIAFADSASGRITIGDRAAWLADDPIDDQGITAPADSSVQDVAIDADGTRLAVAYAVNSGESTTVVIFHHSGRTWEETSSIPVLGDAAVSIDWLE